jgi:hypothetical protein
LTDANIPADGSCTLTVPVSSATPGSYTASIAAGALVTAPAGANAAAATTTLNVTSPSRGGGAMEWYELLTVAALLSRKLCPSVRRSGSGIA